MTQNFVKAYAVSIVFSSHNMLSSFINRDYIRSGWCMEEFRIAHNMVVNGQRKYLIPVLLDGIIWEDLDPDLKLYISTYTYLKADDEMFIKKLRYAMPRTPLHQAHEFQKQKDICQLSTIENSMNGSRSYNSDIFLRPNTVIESHVVTMSKRIACRYHEMEVYHSHYSHQIEATPQVVSGIERQAPQEHWDSSDTDSQNE